MSLPRYPKYKDSGVDWLGRVPEHWTVRRLKHVCKAFPSNVDKKSHEGERPVLLCNYTDVYYNDRITADLQFMAASASPDQIDRFTLRAGDTVITKDSETADDIAVSAYVPDDLPGVVCGYHLSVVRPGADTSGGFVKRLFDSAYTKAMVAVKANGLTRVGLSQYDIDNIEWPWPPSEEQSAIAAFLDRETSKIDALIAEQQRLVELLKEKRQASISHAVTKGLNPDAQMRTSGVEWLGDVPSHWEVTRLKRVTVSMEQGWSPQCESFPAEEDGEWGVLKVGCVNGGRFNPIENKLLPPELDPIPALSIREGDLLVSRANTRELAGSAAVADRDYPFLMLCDKLYRLRFDKGRLNPNFVSFFLGCPAARSRIELDATGASASMVNIAQSTILDLEIALPPIDEQSVIVDTISGRLSSFDALSSEAQRAIDLLEERRAAVITAAVTGQRDVRQIDCEQMA